MLTKSGIEAKSPPLRHTPGRVRLARWLAISADAMQLGIFPLFAEGFASPLNLALDVVLSVSLIALLGFNVAFLPSFFFEAMPLLDLAPTWTIAVFIATRRGPSQPPVMEREPPGKAGETEPPIIDV
jgi:hypothetical protein